MIAYHGTNNIFNEFKLFNNYGYYGKGIYFYPELKQAFNYGNIILTCELNMNFDIILLNNHKELNLVNNSIIYIKDIISEILVIDIDEIKIINSYINI